MKARLLPAVSVAALALLVDPEPASAQQWCDPRTKGWNCYQSWCSSQGGRVNRQTTACEGASPGNSGSRSSGRSSRPMRDGGGGGAAAGFAAMQAQLMTSIMQSLMSSFAEAARQAQETQQRVRAEAEQVWARQIAEERERINRAAAVKSFLNTEAQLSMDKARDMAERLSGSLSGGDGRNLPELAVYEDLPDIFGVQTLKPIYTGNAGALNERQRHACAAGLQGDAAARGLDGARAPSSSAAAAAAYKDALYLSQQARTASGGGTVDVVCRPQLGSVPGVGEGVMVEDPRFAGSFAKAQQALADSNKQMEQTFEKAFSDAETVTRAREKTDTADKALEEAKAQQEEAARRIEALKARPPAPAPAATSPAAPEPPLKPDDDALLREAEAMLRRSNEVRAQAEKAAEDARQALGDAQKQMEQTNRAVEAMARQAGNPPAGSR